MVVNWSAHLLLCSVVLQCKVVSFYDFFCEVGSPWAHFCAYEFQRFQNKFIWLKSCTLQSWISKLSTLKKWSVSGLHAYDFMTKIIARSGLVVPLRFGQDQCRKTFIIFLYMYPFCQIINNQMWQALGIFTQKIIFELAIVHQSTVTYLCSDTSSVASPSSNPEIQVIKERLVKTNRSRKWLSKQCSREHSKMGLTKFTQSEVQLNFELFAVYLSMRSS